MAEIPITGVSDSWLDPGTYIELNFAQGPATSSAGARDICLVGPITSSGAWTANTMYKPDGEADVIAGSGDGAMLHRMYRACVYADPTAKIYCLPYAASSGGSPVAATYQITYATDPTASGRTTVTVGGTGNNGVVAAYDYDDTDTVTTIATAIKSAINSATWLPVTASNAAGVLTLTAKIVGASQGDGTRKGIQVRTYIDSGTGTTVTASGNLGDTVAGADGTTTEAANLLAALNTMTGVRRYWLATSAMDSAGTALGHLQTHITNKSYPRPGLRSQGVAALNDTLANVETAAVARNYERLTLVTQTGTSHDVAHLAGYMVGFLRKAYEGDATANKNGAQLVGIDAAYAVSDWPDGEDRNDALSDGVTIIGSNEGGAYLVKHVTTRSKTAAAGTVPDLRAWSGHKISGADHFADTVLVRHQQQFAGFKLMDDQLDADGNVNANQKIPRKTTTPFWVKRWIGGIYDEYGPDGLNHLQNIAAAKEALRVVRDPNKKSRTEAALQIEVIDHYDQGTFRIDEVSAG